MYIRRIPMYIRRIPMYIRSLLMWAERPPLPPISAPPREEWDTTGFQGVQKAGPWEMPYGPYLASPRRACGWRYLRLASYCGA